MVSSHKETFEKAKNYAFLLLKFRLRSEKELAWRLKKKKYKEPVIRQTLAFLKSRNFIDDEVFARAWITTRLKRPLGLRRIKQELRAKGVEEEIIEGELLEIKKDYCEEDIVRQLAKTKLDKMKEVDPRTARRRVMGYLLRRGFPPDVIIDVLSRL